MSIHTIKTDFQIFNPQDSTVNAVVLLDCSNIDQGAKRLDSQFNYAQLRKQMPDAQIKCFLIEDEYQSTHHKQRRKLKSLGCEMITKKLKYHGTHMSGNFDVEMALEMARIAYHSDSVTHVILGSGDGDFVAGVKLMQSKQIRVWGMAFPNTMSNELRLTLDRYIPLGSDWVCHRPMMNFIWRTSWQTSNV